MSTVEKVEQQRPYVPPPALDTEFPLIDSDPYAGSPFTLISTNAYRVSVTSEECANMLAAQTTLSAPQLPRLDPH
ncbi:MAG: hypothetical protein Q9208_007663 [Pyrenodesmia sp. 3 TL-2023]